MVVGFHHSDLLCFGLQGKEELGRCSVYHRLISGEIEEQFESVVSYSEGFLLWALMILGYEITNKRGGGNR